VAAFCRDALYDCTGEKQLKSRLTASARVCENLTHGQKTSSAAPSQETKGPAASQAGRPADRNINLGVVRVLAMGTWPVNAVRPEYFCVLTGTAHACVSGDDGGAGQRSRVKTGG
jgi:hypothetical protein